MSQMLVHPLPHWNIHLVEKGSACVPGMAWMLQAALTPISGSCAVTKVGEAEGGPAHQLLTELQHHVHSLCLRLVHHPGPDILKKGSERPPRCSVCLGVPEQQYPSPGSYREAF